ncbi:MAG TPA: hypothetical protein VLX91_14000 [Candidatus Acidoferrales bacterium]|nr:hypothetical protein [Candidatus Acidoferrales bacterium]
MSFVCRTLAFVENPETVRIVSEAFQRPKYELEFVGSLNETIPFTNHIDLLVVDSQFLNDKRVATVRHHLPTLVIDPEYIQIGNTKLSACGEESEPNVESEKVRIAAEKLLRKNYFNWIIDALEYSS